MNDDQNRVYRQKTTKIDWHNKEKCAEAYRTPFTVYAPFLCVSAGKIRGTKANEQGEEVEKERQKKNYLYTK